MNEILIYTDIGPDWAGMVSAKWFVDQINAIGKGKSITVRINSPGGDVIDAQAIYNAIRRHSEGGGAVNVEIDGLAASAASYVAMAGDTIRMAENAMMMVHKAWTVSMGNADQLRSTADILDKFDGIITSTYAARSANKTLAEIEQMMADETWLTAQEAVDAGLADSIGQGLKVAACVRPGRYQKTPQRFLEPVSDRRTDEDSQNASHRLEVIRQKIRLTRVR